MLQYIFKQKCQSPPLSSEAPIHHASSGILPHASSVVILFEVHSLCYSKDSLCIFIHISLVWKPAWSKYLAEFVTDLAQFILRWFKVVIFCGALDGVRRLAASYMLFGAGRESVGSILTSTSWVPPAGSTPPSRMFRPSWLFCRLSCSRQHWKRNGRHDRSQAIPSSSVELVLIHLSGFCLSWWANYL
jgi:hypothetical protein